MSAPPVPTPKPAAAAAADANSIPGEDAEPNYDDLLPEDLEELGVTEEVLEDVPPEEEVPEEPAGGDEGFTPDPGNIPDFIRTGAKFTSIVKGIAELHGTTDAPTVIALLRAYQPYSPKIQQSIDGVSEARIKGIIRMD